MSVSAEVLPAHKATPEPEAAAAVPTDAPGGAMPTAVGGLSRPRPTPEDGEHESESEQTGNETETGTERETPAPKKAVSGKLTTEPRTMAELLACSNMSIRVLCGKREARGPLMTLLINAFEADWFKAKSCLVFDKWPAGKPAFSHEMGLELMSALTELRGAVHTAVKPLAQKRVKIELAKRAEQLKGNAKLGGKLSNEVHLDGDDQVKFKGSVGADTVTSDVDVSTGGRNSELAVRAYNEAFREYLDLPFDPGTVFDLNVYAMDFIHGFDEKGTEGTKIVPKAENKEKPDAQSAGQRDREQDIWALVHVARYMPDDADWDAYVTDAVKGLPPNKEAEQRDRLAIARRRAKGFEYRLLSMMEQLCSTLDLGLGGVSSWAAADEEHFEEGALRMRAANKLYEDKLLQVKELRLRIEETRKALAGPKPPPGAADELPKLIARLDGELSMAQLYANEVYGSGGATVHAVMGMQVPKSLSAERKKKVTAELPKQHLLQAFNDNLGDVLKDYEHYGKAEGHGTPDYWYAAFKMGKYAHRLVDTLPQLATGAPDDLMESGELAALLQSDEMKTLKELADQHLEQKGGDGGKDPVKLKRHPYFGGFDEGRLKGLRAAAIKLGAAVRVAVAKKDPHEQATLDRGPVGSRENPVQAEPITAEQFKRMRSELSIALKQARALNSEAAGPAAATETAAH